MVEDRRVTPNESIMMAVWIAIIGSVITLLIAFVLGRLVDGITADWPAPANVVEALLVAIIARFHLVVAAIGLYLTGALVVNTILHDRNQIHYRANAEQDIELEERRAHVERLRLENEVARMKLAQLTAGNGAPADLQINDRQSSGWTLVVNAGSRQVELDGRFVEAYGRLLREGRVTRDLLRQDEKLHFTDTDYKVLRILMRQGGAESDRGVDQKQLAGLLDLWRTTRVARAYQDDETAAVLQLGAPNSSRARA
jgi:hypothetical protein